MMVIALGSDHAGFALKEHLEVWLAAEGHAVLDVGPHSHASVDYPDYAAMVGAALIAGRATRGVLVCGTGTGMAIAANKMPGIRAAACADAYVARMSREHNDTNVLALGAWLTKPDAAIEIVGAWLAAAFAGGRHARRVAKLDQADRTCAGAP
jgi:ribose 5-phosphate isomerase B